MDSSFTEGKTGALLSLVRHGQSEGNVNRLWEGARSDSPLTELGEQQADATGEYLEGLMGGARIYTSPLKRARQTAERIARRTKGEIEVVDNLIEIDWGDLEGLTTQQVGERYPAVLEHWGTKLSSPLPGGEAATAVGKRVAEALEMIADREMGKSAVVVSHQGAIALGLLSLLNQREGFEEFQIPNCAVHLVRFDPTPTIEALAWREHLSSRGIESAKWRL